MAMSRSFGITSLTTRPPIADLAARDHLEAGDHPQQRGLAAARGADEHDELAVLDVDADAVHDLHGAVALDDVPDGDLGHLGSYCGSSICIFTSPGGAEAASSKASTLSSKPKVRVISGFTSIAPDASMAMQRGKTWA